MGRAPCCDKANVKKGPWSPEEDAKLKSYIEQHGTGGNWIALPQKIGLRRCGKSCRLRWLNYLRPNIKHGGFSEEEDNIICSLYISIGSRWSIIAAQLPGRTDNDIKNYWNTRLKKKLLGKQRKEQQQAARRSSCGLNLEAKRGTANSMASENDIKPYWPQLPAPMTPIPYSDQGPCFNDHASIRKLLIKLGGRFSNDDQNLLHLPYNIDISSSMQHVHNRSMDFLASAPAGALNNAISDQLANTQYSLEGLGLNVLPGQTNFSGELDEVVYCDGPHKFDGIEFLCGEEDMGKARSGTSWGTEMSSLVYPSAVASINHEGLHQGMLQECGFSELGYPGAQ